MIYNLSYKTLIGRKPLCIRFDKIDGIIRIYDGTRYLVLFDPEKYGSIYSRIRYFIRLKNSVFSHYYAKFKVGSYDAFPIKKTLTLHNVIRLIKSVLNKDQNHYYCNKFLEKSSYQLAKKL